MVRKKRRSFQQWIADIDPRIILGIGLTIAVVTYIGWVIEQACNVWGL